MLINFEIFFNKEMYFIFLFFVLKSCICLSEKKISYDNNLIDNNKNSIIFLNGYSNSRNNSLSLFLKNVSEKKNYNYLTFDNFGHGNASGNLYDQNITDFLSGIDVFYNEKLKYLNKNTKKVLIGWSLGGYIGMLSLKKYNDFFDQIYLLSPSIDFVETQMNWYELKDEEKNKMKESKIVTFTSPILKEKISVSYNLILDALRYSLLKSKFLETITIPVYIIHGYNDDIINYNISLRLLKSLKTTSELLLINNCNHYFLDKYKNIEQILNNNLP